MDVLQGNAPLELVTYIDKDGVAGDKDNDESSKLSFQVVKSA